MPEKLSHSHFLNFFQEKYSLKYSYRKRVERYLLGDWKTMWLKKEGGTDRSIT
jgi:hypothetical protein